MAKSRITSPVLRFVQGSVDEPQTKDAAGNIRTIKTGPNAGQPNPQFFVAGAIAKGDPTWPPFWAALVTQAAADFPALFPYGAQPIIDAGGPERVPQGYILHPQFSFKVIDGDGLDQNGKPNNQKEGFAGCYVVRFASSYPPRCFHAGRYAAHEQIQEKGAVKRGYYIRVNGSIEGNGNAQRPGLYVNLDMVELAGYGPEIVSGPDAETAFSGGPAALPAGASATPVAAAPLAAPPPVAATGYPAAVSPAPVSPPPVAPPVAPPPAAAPAPYTQYMAPPPPLAPAPAAAPPPAPVAPVSAPPATLSPTSGMTAKAAGSTYEQMIAAGWTDATLREHGYMI